MRACIALLIAFYLCFYMQKISYAGDNNKAVSCDYAETEGRLFELRPLPKDKKTYRGWHRTLDRQSSIPASYAGRKGKILLEEVYSEYNTPYRVALFDDCERAYIIVLNGDYYETDNVYYLSQINDAENLIGKHIWLNRSTIWIHKKEWLDPNALKHIITFPHLTRLTVKKIIRRPAFSGAPNLYLEVQSQYNNVTFKYPHDKGPWEQGFYFRRYPIDQTWDEAIRRAILLEELRIGMSKKQAELAWGAPWKKQRSIDSSGTTEYWYYHGRFVHDGKIKIFNDRVESWEEGLK